MTVLHRVAGRPVAGACDNTWWSRETRGRRLFVTTPEEARRLARESAERIRKEADRV